jgi:hypothetical protein
MEEDGKKLWVSFLSFFFSIQMVTQTTSDCPQVGGRWITSWGRMRCVRWAGADMEMWGDGSQLCLGRQPWPFTHCLPGLQIWLFQKLEIWTLQWLSWLLNAIKLLRKMLALCRWNKIILSLDSNSGPLFGCLSSDFKHQLGQHQGWCCSEP